MTNTAIFNTSNKNTNNCGKLRETDRQIDRQTDRQTDRNRETEAERDRQKHRERKSMRANARARGRAVIMKSIKVTENNETMYND